MNTGQLNEITKRLDALVESDTTMKDEMYIAFRSYLEENSSLLRQILEKLDAHTATTPIPEGAARPQASAVKMPSEAVGPVTVETVETLDSGAEPKPVAGKSKPGAKPNVNWNS